MANVRRPWTSLRRNVSMIISVMLVTFISFVFIGASVLIQGYASFIGTSNLKDLLTDPSGSRRFICIEVTGPIQTNVTINYHQLYAQAMHDIMKGERYWLDDTDEAIVKEYNREFERVDPLEELFLCHFRGAEESEEGEWLTAMQIFNDLQQKTRDKLAINRIAAFGRTLRKLDILNKKSNRGTLYHLVRIEE